jgi:hypothetical protein
MPAMLQALEIVLIICFSLFNVKVAHHSQTGQQQN